MNNIKNNETGLTMIELLISIAVIGIIIVAFIPLFLMSAKTNTRSEVTLNSTYLGKDAMEVAYYLSKTVSYESLEEKLKEKLEKKEYIEISKDISENIYVYEYKDKKYLTIKFKEEGNLIRVIVKIYKDENMNKLESQYESLYSWFGRDILNGEQ